MVLEIQFSWDEDIFKKRHNRSDNAFETFYTVEFFSTYLFHDIV